MDSLIETQQPLVVPSIKSNMKLLFVPYEKADGQEGLDDDDLIVFVLTDSIPDRGDLVYFWTKKEEKVRGVVHTRVFDYVNAQIEIYIADIERAF